MTARIVPPSIAPPAGIAADAPVVLLGGWGMRAAALEELRVALGAMAVLELPDIPAGDARTREDFLHAWLDRRVPRGAVLVGWSFGGTLAIDWCARRPGWLAALVTLACNPCFRRRADWPLGMADEQFAGFANALQAEPARLLTRFAALQAQGDREARVLARRLRDALAPASSGGLGALLQQLGGADVRARLAELTLPVLHVLGSEDALVPADVAAGYARLHPAASVWVAQGCAHAPFLSRPAATAARIADFLASRRAPADCPRSKREVARSFARAAPAYEGADAVQRASADALLELAPAGLEVQRALDLGCGTGAQLAALHARFPRAHWTALDMADGMLRQVAREHPRVPACGADAESLPFAAGCFDLVYSNLVLQWCEAPRAVFAELARVLRPGGVALVATLGPDTLWELRAAWRALDRDAHVNRFEDPERLLAMARDAGLAPLGLRRELRTERHAGAREVAAGLRRIGAHNLDPARPRGLTGRGRWRALESAYAELGDGGPGVPATWQLVHLVLARG